MPVADSAITWCSAPGTSLSIVSSPTWAPSAGVATTCRLALVPPAASTTNGSSSGGGASSSMAKPAPVTRTSSSV